MYTPGPTEHELAAFGLTMEDFAGDVVEVWPENERAYRVFADLRTQWRVAMGGASGLDYNVLFAKLDRMQLSPHEYDELEDDVRTMEYAALERMAEEAQESRKKT